MYREKYLNMFFYQYLYDLFYFLKLRNRDGVKKENINLFFRGRVFSEQKERPSATQAAPAVSLYTKNTSFQANFKLLLERNVVFLKKNPENSSANSRNKVLVSQLCVKCYQRAFFGCY